MPIVGLTFSSFEGRRLKKKITGEVKINSTPRILKVKEVSMPPMEKKVLSMEFEFGTSYEPDLGNITIKGELAYLPENNVDVLKTWNSENRLPEEVNIDVLNNLFRRCLIKISTIAEDLQLPPPISIPRIKPKGEDPSYVG